MHLLTRLHPPPPPLDAAPHVFRYAWYTARVPHRVNETDEGSMQSDLLPGNSTSLVPTSTGRIYMPAKPTVEEPQSPAATAAARAAAEKIVEQRAP